MDNKLPSRFQIGDKVKCKYGVTELFGVRFTAEKVYYEVMRKDVKDDKWGPVISILDSCEVEPVE